MIGRSGERGSGISVLAARDDDDDDLDANKKAGEKARRQLHKNAAGNIEQVLEATPHKAPTIRPPISETSRKVHLPWKQCLIDRDTHQHATKKGMDSYQ